MEKKVKEAKQIIKNKIEPLQFTIKTLAVFMSLYHIYNIIGGGIEPFFYRYTHLFLAIFLGFLLSSSEQDNFEKICTLILGTLTVLLYIYFFTNYKRLVELIPGVSKLTNSDKIFGILLIFLILEASRRYISWVLPLIGIIFSLYIFAGPYLSGILYFKGLSFEYVLHYLVYTFEGIFGSAIAVSSEYIVLFLIFGNFLRFSGVGDYFVKLATSIAGGSRGGPAKIAVLSSAFIGTIIGAPTANVVITGTFTIPLMKKNGFTPDFAAGVEAAASTGGLILPPIMGSTAFIMAEILGIPYLQVAKASLIPAMVYFMAILFMVDFYAAKNNLFGLTKQERPSLISVIKESYNLFPLTIITIMLIKGFSPSFAAIWGIVSSLFVGIFHSKNKPFIKEITNAFEKAATTAIQIILACAVSGIIMGTFSLTGLSGKLTRMLLQSINNIEILILFLIMISALIMGMGLAITPTYLLCVVLGAPSLISLGFKPIAVHLFILYFAVLAPLTPPFAITSYVAANIAGGKLNKTALYAMFLASSGFIIPYMFIYHNELLMIGNGTSITISLIKLIIGVFCLAGGIQGFLFKTINIYQRIAIAIGGLLVASPGLLSDLFGLGLLGVFLFSLMEKTRIISNILNYIVKGEHKDL